MPDFARLVSGNTETDDHQGFGVGDGSEIRAAQVDSLGSQAADHRLDDDPIFSADGFQDFGDPFQLVLLKALRNHDGSNGKSRGARFRVGFKWASRHLDQNVVFKKTIQEKFGLAAQASVDRLMLTWLSRLQSMRLFS